jgi:hypothetical protein
LSTPRNPSHAERSTNALQLVISKSIELAGMRTSRRSIRCSRPHWSIDAPEHGQNDGAGFPQPRKELVSDYSVVVDLEKHAIFAFWYESTGHLIPSVPAALPIKEANAGGISFAAERKTGRTERHITGGVDRATGAVNADGFTIYSGGASQHESWSLHCTPTPNAVLGVPLKRVAEPNP